MNRLSKTAKFFIICGAVFVLGLICTIGGVAAGGIDGLEKVAEDHDWVAGSPGERGVTAQKVETFDSINVSGQGDVWLVGRSFYQNASRLTEEDLLYPTEMDLMKKNQVLVIAGDKVEQPTIGVRDKVLSIEFNNEEFNGINLDSSDIGWTPIVLICCPQDPLEKLAVSSEVADINCLGVAWKQANIQLNTGDITMEDVESHGLQLHLDTGDARMQGMFMNVTSIESEVGDIKISTSLQKEEYGLDLTSGTGDITVITPEGKWEADLDEDDDSMNSVCREPGGPNMITGSLDTGDIEIQFGK